MTFTESDLSDLLAAVQSSNLTDTIRSSLVWLLQQLIEAELTATIGAGPHERTESRSAQRNGHRPRLVSTQMGDIEIEIPKLREGSFFPSLLERRRRIDRALLAVVMEAWVHGVSTRPTEPASLELPAASHTSGFASCPMSISTAPSQRSRKLAASSRSAECTPMACSTRWLPTPTATSSSCSVPTRVCHNAPKP